MIAPYYESLQEQKKNGVEVKMLDEAPIVLSEATYYLKAFERLSASRGRVDGSYLPIEITEIESLCRMLREYDPLELMDIVQTLDKQYIKHYASK